MTLPHRVRLVVEVPRGGFVKRDAKGAVDYVSPLPSPFNYGAVPDLPSSDGEGLDVVLLGRRRARGWTGEVAVRAVVRFVDGGQVDDKLVCSDRPVRAWERWLVIGFFVAYGLGKRVSGGLAGGRSAYLGWEPLCSPSD